LRIAVALTSGALVPTFPLPPARRILRPCGGVAVRAFVTPEERADRLHAAISTTFEGFYGAVDGASFERRDGHARLLFPAVPIPIFNGVVVESEPVSGIAASIREVEDHHLRCGILVREGRHPEVEEELAQLGFTERDPMPGMTMAPDELADVRVSDLEIVRVEDEAGLAEAARVAAEGGGMPLEYMPALYAPGILTLDGNKIYVGRVAGEPVTTAIGYQTGRDVAIFSVATVEPHRRRGYGAAITAHACRAAFAGGADLAWLQTSKIGESVYRALGFRHVEMHLMFARPDRRAQDE
jgi:N-acetylglutamate synthase